MGARDRKAWYDTRQMGQEFQTLVPGSPLPPGLWFGPPPGLVSGDNLSGSQLIEGGSAPSQELLNTLPEPWRTLMFGIQRKGNYIPMYGTVGTQAVLIRPKEARTYLIIQNPSLANTLIVGVGYAPVVGAGGPTGLVLAAGGGSFEPQVIPQQDIWLAGSAASTQFVMHVAQG